MEPEVNQTSYTKDEIFKIVEIALKETVTTKIIDDITMETSLIEDIALDSIEIMAMFIKLQEKLDLDFSSIDMEEWLTEYLEVDEGEKLFSISSICDQILNLMKEGGENGKN